jgi:hypothetical protein
VKPEEAPEPRRFEPFNHVIGMALAAAITHSIAALAKRIVADQVLDMSAMKELLGKHW